MIARNSFALALAAVLCATLVVASSNEDRDLYKKIVQKLVDHRAFQYKRSTVQLEIFMFDLKRQYEAETGRQDERDCLDSAASKAQKEGQEFIKGVIDPILPKLDSMYEITQSIASTDEQWEEVGKFAHDNDYETYKNTCLKNFNTALKGWLEQKEKVFQDCVPLVH